jgi:hypothetical protein
MDTDFAPVFSCQEIVYLFPGFLQQALDGTTYTRNCDAIRIICRDRVQAQNVYEKAADACPLMRLEQDLIGINFIDIIEILADGSQQRFVKFSIQDIQMDRSVLAVAN